MTDVKTWKGADGADYAYSPESQKTYRFPTFEQSLLSDTDDELWAEVYTAPLNAVPCLKELAMRGDETAIRALNARGVTPPARR
jgi:hypothetical protein